MPDPTPVPFFNPSDITGLGGDWVVQENNLALALQRTGGLGATGDEVASKTHGGKTSGTVVLECHEETGNLTLPNAGSVAGGYVLEKEELKYQPTGWPRLTLTLHQHSTNPHATGLRESVPSLVFPAQFGIPRTVDDGKTPVVAQFSLGDTAAGITDLTYTLGVTHLDEDQNGDHLAGENRDGVETLSVGFTKDPETVTGPAGWDKLNDGTTKGNTAAEKSSMAWEHHVECVVPA